MIRKINGEGSSLNVGHLNVGSKSYISQIPWQSGILPDSWKETVVIPIPKPSKDSTNTANYRNIALKRCICKRKWNEWLMIVLFGF